jgi:ATP-dependent HslUV protease ATP-binding subunit HslU
LEVATAVENKLLEALVGQYAEERDREAYRQMLKDGEMEQRTIDVEMPARGPGEKGPLTVDMSNPAFMASELLKFAKAGGGQGKKMERRKMTVAEARPVIEEAETERLLDDYDIPKEAIASVEESGIVFIDEIDKLVSSSEYRGADASSEGVQRDLLPLIEGSTINTKHGNVNTDFILFIASGAFHSSKPSDLLAELQVG